MGSLDALGIFFCRDRHSESYGIKKCEISRWVGKAFVATDTSSLKVIKSAESLLDGSKK